MLGRDKSHIYSQKQLITPKFDTVVSKDRQGSKKLQNPGCVGKLKLQVFSKRPQKESLHFIPVATTFVIT